MRKTLRAVELSLIICLFLLSTAYAVPNRISYQGMLNDSGGVPVSATLSMTFAIHDADTNGTQLWQETQSVEVSNGVFNVQLGAVQPLPGTLFETDELYLGIAVDYDEEMKPRQLITSGGYAFKASTVEETIVPVGTIMAWAKNLPGVPSLTEEWVECNGQVLDDPESPLDGQVIPGLNGENRFLRGSTSTGGLGGSDSHTHNIGYVSGPYSYGNTIKTGSVSDASDTSPAVEITAGYYGGYIGTITNRTSSNLPRYYEVVWIMKIK